jgi:hypothetical protein
MHTNNLFKKIAELICDYVEKNPECKVNDVRDALIKTILCFAISNVKEGSCIEYINMISTDMKEYIHDYDEENHE